MSKKKPTSNQKEQPFDQHIVDALLKMKTPIIGINGIKFYVRDEARYEDGIHHIAKKMHRLKIRDIETVPEILRHPKVMMADPNNKNYKNYYGIRKGVDTNTLIKIVTWPYEHASKKELIITIFPTNSIKIE